MQAMYNSTDQYEGYYPKSVKLTINFVHSNVFDSTGLIRA